MQFTTPMTNEPLIPFGSDARSEGMGTHGELPACPLGRDCRLRVLNSREMFAECIGVEAKVCPHALCFGGGFFCREVWTVAR